MLLAILCNHLLVLQGLPDIRLVSTHAQDSSTAVDMMGPRLLRRCTGSANRHQAQGMDVEASYRADLISALGSDFLCFEEVEIEHSALPGMLIRADVVAVPVDENLWAHALAFEVKAYGDQADYGKWTAAIKQASDYVLGRIRSDHHVLARRRISAALVYPAPAHQSYVPRHDVPPDISNRIMITGAFQCALHWRVGRAHFTEREGLSLSFGPLEFWSTRRGFTAQAQNLLKNRRPIGSRSVDVCSLLDGFDATFPEFE
jgi:hypothetical protein